MNARIGLLLASAVVASLAVSCAKREMAPQGVPMQMEMKQASGAASQDSTVSDEPASRMAGENQAQASETSPPAMAGRILVKTGGLTLIVGEAPKAQEALNGLISKYEAYVAGKQSEAWVPTARYLAPSEVRQMTFTIKVPADRFDAFVEEVKAIGSYTNESMQIEDVTFQYVDLDARLSNQKKVEARLLGHLQTSAKELKDIVEVERELARVREQIETLTAQFKVLKDRVAFSTLTLTLSVQPDFVPPVERSFFQQLGDKFLSSLEALGDAVKVGTILGLAALPWLLVMGGGMYVLARLIRWWRAKRKKQ